ncbi:hypothetical protein NFI96_020731 [Prochilodus magdalenae]|nr:hypothetical protein NFI96_020731 [Prochilodus magdalenae]
MMAISVSTSIPIYTHHPTALTHLRPYLNAGWTEDLLTERMFSRIMMMQLSFLLVCLTGLAEGLPLGPRPAPPAPEHPVLIPVKVLSPYGPQVVLIPMTNAEWNTKGNLNSTPQTFTLFNQHQMKGENVAEAESVNRPFLQPNTPPSPDTHTLPHTPESAQPQGQLFPVWNSLPVVPMQPSVTGQNFIPSLATPAGGAGGQTQVYTHFTYSVCVLYVYGVCCRADTGDWSCDELFPVWNSLPVVPMQPSVLFPVWNSLPVVPMQPSVMVSVVRQILGVIYLLPVSAEIPNMGMAEGGQGGANLNTNTDPNLGHLQQPTPSPSPSFPAGLQESPAPTTEVPSAGVKRRPEGVSEGTPATTPNPCAHRGHRASVAAKGPLL